MEKYHHFKKGELVWCTLYPGIYEVVNVKDREKEKGKQYSDLLTIELRDNQLFTLLSYLKTFPTWSRHKSFI